MPKVKACGITHRGYVRRINQDAILLDEYLVQEDFMQEPIIFESEGDHFIFAVADGLGGHPKGEVASRLVLDVIRKERPKTLSQLNNALHKAQDMLIDYTKAYPDAIGLGTALAGILIYQSLVYVFNVGDCRVYAIKEEEVEVLTKDHRNPDGTLYSAILGHPSRWEFEMDVKELKPYGRFLICSDGLWEFVDSEKLNRPIEELLDLSLLSGGYDNVSIVTVELF